MTTERALQKPLVLLVDDFSDSRTMYAEFLEASGFRVEQAEDGIAAVSQALALAPDVIVMDLGLPGIDGIEATLQIKGDPRTAHIPVIAVSGHSGAKAREALAAGCAEIATKPCLPDELAERIERVLGRGG